MDQLCLMRSLFLPHTSSSIPCKLSERKLSTSDIAFSEKPIEQSFCSSFWCDIESKAFERYLLGINSLPEKFY